MFFDYSFDEMSTKEIYIQLVSGKLTLTQALSLTLLEAPLSSEEREWVESEIKGYLNKNDVPDYRRLNCEIYVRIQNRITGAIQEVKMRGGALDLLDSRLKKETGMSIFTLYVLQGVDLIEQQFAGHSDGDVNLPFDGKLSQLLIKAVISKEQRFSFDALNVFQSAPVAYIHNMLSVIKASLLSVLKKHIFPTAIKSGWGVEKDSKRKVVFISYCWEDDEHVSWVRKLANDLNNDFEVVIDQDLPYGAELTKFMEDAIASADKVLIIATPEYKNRSDNRMRGVGYETSLITSDLVTDQNKLKFIPIIRKGTMETSYPSFLGTKKGADMRDDDKYLETLNSLKMNLNKY